MDLGTSQVHKEFLPLSSENLGTPAAKLSLSSELTATHLYPKVREAFPGILLI